jgi:hypothetical protein
MNSPSSFCTICTNNCKQELAGFLLSLSLHHPNEKVYVMCDTDTQEYIYNMSIEPSLKIIWNVTLDPYSKFTRAEMEKNGLWSDFQMAKADVIQIALMKEKDTLFLDCDTIILDRIEDIDFTKELGVSPQFIKQENVDEVGYYNGGMLWTNNVNVPIKWREYTKTSRYFDQASIEDLVKEFKYFEFGENYNLQTWRFLLGVDDIDTIVKNLNIRFDRVYYKDKRLKFIHTHFNKERFKVINKLFKTLLRQARCYKELLCIGRVENDGWELQIPKQPITGLYRHKNDSYRELALLLKMNNKDVKLSFTESSHCWLKPDILLYDRPTLEWVNKELNEASLVLLGNGGDEEMKKLDLFDYNVKPWIFWPRRPMILEKFLEEKGLLAEVDRHIETIFIGNYENSVQEKYRTGEKWENVIQQFVCTKGSKHKFTQTEYLNKLRSSKYGLCLRGYGSKCHREVELMAFGTVPILTPGVSTNYLSPLKENVHYLKVKSPEELKIKLKTITNDEWQLMSQSCFTWYQENIHSRFCWKTLINKLLYN